MIFSIKIYSSLTGVIGFHRLRIERCLMPDVTYQIVQHDGGWAYRVNGVFSETFSTHRVTARSARCNRTERCATDATVAIGGHPR